MRAGRWVTGWGRVRILGEKPERLLQALAEKGIGFWDVQPPEDFVLSLSMSLSSVETLGAMAPEFGCETEVLSRHGLPALWRRGKKRRALLLGLTAVLFLLGVSRLFVWNIELSGAEEIPRTEVLAALEECGVELGAFWPVFSQDLIRNGMLLQLPELRWMTVNIRGSTAEVILRTRYEAEELLDEDEFVKIVAARAGYVTEVNALRGTALVEENAAVLPGQTLIDGLATGRYDSHGAIRAIGSARARTWYELAASAPTEIQIRTETGREQSRWALVLGKRRINFYKGYSICPSGCVKMSNEVYLALEGLFSLPVYLVRETATEYQLRRQTAPELRAELEELLYAELLERIGDGGEVLQVDFAASEADGLLTVTLRAECEQEIGKTVLMTAEEIASKIPAAEEADE